MCRAFLAPWYERGGMQPEDENDVPVFIGRFNIGAVSLHLPMILAKARQENKDFHKVLDIMNSIQNANRFETDKTYNFCSYKFSLFKNIALLRLRRLLGPKRKLMHYKKGK